MLKGKTTRSISQYISLILEGVATLTTVGYGDVYPVTAIGKVISGVIAIHGIGIVALRN